VRKLIAPLGTGRILSRRAQDELNSLQANVHSLGSTRNKALRLFMASRNVTTPIAQQEFWLEFSWADQEYRVAVRRLAEFCGEQAARRHVRAMRP
jgi:hypothetical protein